MRWGLRGRRGLSDGGNAELDARLSEAWEAAAVAVGMTLDLPAGKEALLVGAGLLPDEAADVPTAAALTRGTERRRRRRLVLGSVAGGAAALAAGAVALVAVVVPGGGHSGVVGPGPRGASEPAVTAAYVVQRVDSALSAAGPGEIAEITVTTAGTTTTGEEWSYGGQWRLVTYSSSGQPVQDAGFSTSTSVYTLVNYQERIWTRQSGQGQPGKAAPPVSGSRGCKQVLPALTSVFQPGLPGIDLPARSAPATVASALRTAVSCGTLTVAGRQRVDGTEAIELTSRPGSLVAETIWVNPDTWLPVRVTARVAALQRTANIAWLQPTAQHLAKLTVPIPAGFRQVPLSQAVEPVIQQIPGGPATP
jgi:hypothetical protein